MGIASMPDPRVPATQNLSRLPYASRAGARAPPVLIMRLAAAWSACRAASLMTNMRGSALNGGR